MPLSIKKFYLNTLLLQKELASRGPVKSVAGYIIGSDGAVVEYVTSSTIKEVTIFWRIYRDYLKARDD